MEDNTIVKTQRTFTGKVSSVSGEKSVLVEVARRFQHARYHKPITRKTRYMAHDESSSCAVGDVVEIEECRPLSARKRWRVVRTLTKAAI